MSYTVLGHVTKKYKSFVNQANYKKKYLLYVNLAEFGHLAENI